MDGEKGEEGEGSLRSWLQATDHMLRSAGDGTGRKAMKGSFTSWL